MVQVLCWKCKLKQASSSVRIKQPDRELVYRMCGPCALDFILWVKPVCSPRFVARGESAG